MRRLLVLCSAIGLMCGALGCECCGGGHTHGRCDCDDGPAYGCHYDMYTHGSDHGAVPVSMSAAPSMKAMPADIMPKDDTK